VLRVAGDEYADAVQVVKSGFCIVDVVILVDAKIMHVD
jgi:hypothetical protein